MNETSTGLVARGDGVDPLGDGEALDEAQARRNYAKVGSARPSTLLYTYGPGAIIDLPHFTVMPTGLEDWERIWARRNGPVPTIHAPRLLESVQIVLGRQVGELRPFPHQDAVGPLSRQGADLGVPARIFPQWMRCTGCDRLAPLSVFASGYSNTRPHRPDEARVDHESCPGRPGRAGAPRGARHNAVRRRTRRSLCVPARYLLACPAGHLDEFPYDWWVHQGAHCTKAEVPVLRMTDTSASRGSSAVIICDSCGMRRTMSQAQGEAGRARLPRCRGRLPHVDGFVPGCRAETRLMLVGASNLWFPLTQSIIDMPRTDAAGRRRDDARRLASALGEQLEDFAAQIPVIRALIQANGTCPDLADLGDAALAGLVAQALDPGESEEELRKRRETWGPAQILVPEWTYLQRDPEWEHHEHKESGLTLSPRRLDDHPIDGVSRVLAVDRLRKVNALLGFTRIDDYDRVDESQAQRLVPLARGSGPTWVPATEDRGEGMLIQLDEDRVARWEARVESSALWAAHVEAHRRNFERRYSETARQMDHMERMQPPRYWLVHTLAHALMRQMAMHSGYGAASLSERIYAWGRDEGRESAAGALIVTTASDSDGTLGGLVSLSEPARLKQIMTDALTGLGRCSSDPVCARRVPQDPEDFLHGAACHCCVMASETSCERANRFLDRRFVVPLPGWSELAYFRP